MSLILHTGGEFATLEDLKSVPLPKETDSYKPVSHHDLATNLARVSRDLLLDYSMVKSQFGLAKNGNQMFGVHTYQNGSDQLGLSIGFRNSYDKSLSIGVAIGASVFVCDNLAFTGDVSIMRKHTANVWNDLEEMVITTIYRSKSNFRKIEEDAHLMKEIPLHDDEAYRLLGLLYGNNVLSPRQLPVAKQQWLKPKHPDFESRSLWSLYNAVTESLKSCNPAKIMEKHILLHDLALNEMKGNRYDHIQ